jgi:transcriptional regulator with XRE-family HTH domain
MRKHKEILRLRFEANLSYRQIAGSLNLSYGVVAKYALVDSIEYRSSTAL